MQTFLPYPEFVKSARALDRQRLGKQRIEAKLLLEIALGRESRWASHPASLMWQPYPWALAMYGWHICTEWRRRGYRDEQLPFFDHHIRLHRPNEVPPWLGDQRFHASHRAALLFKLPKHYRQFGWSESPAIEYFWPVTENPYARRTGSLLQDEAGPRGAGAGVVPEPVVQGLGEVAASAG
jgi:hypothetical protein